ncbi:MAG: GNAT family N-acetyltransferase, partial [Actinobacteria bacterium]|nr:GNAT family N-acetyltransferase [Actinomycetota bacterium]
VGRRAAWHVGDLAWGFRCHEGREQEWRIRLWEEGGSVVAWSWLKTSDGTLDFDVRVDRRELLEEILDEPDARIVYAFEDDDEVAEGLARRGFGPGDAKPLHFHAGALDRPPEPPPLPDGFRYGTVEPDELPERVAAHRDVWNPSRVTASSYANLVATWPYRASLDCVVEAPDGRTAAYCLAWPDDENGVGEFEPVGVRDEFRRRGLGAAVCTFALRRLWDEGMREAIVYCVQKPACALYDAVGLPHHSTMAGWQRG